MKQLIELETGECRWPLEGSPFPYLFCACAAERVDNGFKPYCSEHMAVAYQPWVPRVRVGKAA